MKRFWNENVGLVVPMGMFAVLIISIIVVAVTEGDEVARRFDAACAKAGGSSVYNGAYWECIR